MYALGFKRLTTFLELYTYAYKNKPIKDSPHYYSNMTTPSWNRTPVTIETVKHAKLGVTSPTTGHGVTHIEDVAHLLLYAR